MQADEDIGKVAQATPTAVAKALELFMASLTVKAAAEARLQGGSRRITVGHLKAAIGRVENFDFLKSICDAAGDEDAKGAATKKARGKSEDVSDDEMPPKTKKRKGSAEEGD
jgi:Dr1-associated corepressor